MFRISSCPSVSQEIQGEIAMGLPAGPEQPRGLVAFFSGGTGQAWWGDYSPMATSFLGRLRRVDRIEVVQVRWAHPWLYAASGEDAGSAHLACRPATTIKWIHDHIYTPAGGAPGACGFCITGSSGGASQVSYALSHYGLDSIVDAAIPTSGPPHAAQTKGCQPGFAEYRYQDEDLPVIDASFGFLAGPGPCATEDSAWVPRWNQESVDTGGNDYWHPTTRIEFVIGGQDDTVAPAHAVDYRDVLEAYPGNSVTWTTVATMPHDVQLSKEGLRALEAALLGAV
jgi:hypothetical protein